MDLARVINSRKYMWDGATLEDKAQAEETKKKYKEDKFEAEIVEEDGKYFLFTRRLVEEVVVDGSPI